MKQAVLLSAASVAMLGSVAMADTVSYSAEVPVTFTDWNRTLSLPKFDSALGTLLSVQFSLAGTNRTASYFENRDTGGWTITTGSDVSIVLNDPLASTLVAVTPIVRFVNEVTGDDGTLDYGGSGGFTNPEQTVGTSAARLLVAQTDDVSPYVGAGNFSVGVAARATGFYEGSGDYFFFVQTRASAVVQVTYEYQPPQEDPLGSIGDRVWHDENSDGIQDPDETGLVGWTVTLIDADTNTVLGSQDTAADGLYLFDALPAGNYRVTVTPKPQYSQTFDLDGLATAHTALATLAPGEHRRDVDYGYVFVPLGSIGDRVWHDVNQDGVQDPNEVGLEGWTVTLFNSAGQQLDQMPTGTDGLYLFDELPAGNYTVTVTPLPNWVQTYDLDGLGTAHTATASLAVGQNRRDVDFGYVFCPPATGSIGDRVWFDCDKDGCQDSGEPGLVGWTVTLYNATTGAQLGVQQTGANGLYLFTGLAAGSYRVTVTPEPDHIQTYDLDGLSTAHTAVASLAAGQNRRDVDFGYYFCRTNYYGSVGDLVWLDCDGDGVKDSNEPGLRGWTVKLLNASGSVISTKTTDSSGKYLFSNLQAGTYSVVVTPSSGYDQTYDLDGLISSNKATFALASGQNRRDVDFGYRKQGSGWNGCGGNNGCGGHYYGGCSQNNGCDGNYWGSRGCDDYKPRHLACLSKCKLVDRNGCDIDFTDCDTDNFGGKGCRNYYDGCTKLSKYCKDADTYNMAHCLSRELACLKLNVECGKISKTKRCSYNGQSCTVEEWCNKAENCIKEAPCTPKGHSKRGGQDSVRNCLSSINRSCR